MVDNTESGLKVSNGTANFTFVPNGQPSHGDVRGFEEVVRSIQSAPKETSQASTDEAKSGRATKRVKKSK